MKKRLIIAIDGPSGAGKSTVSKLLAKKLNYVYVDTGAMYRAVALRVQEEDINLDDDEILSQLCLGINISFCTENGASRILLDGRDVAEAIRSPDISLLASRVSAMKVVRDPLLMLQRKVGENGGVIVEGRDIGTVVFPDADIKFYLTALSEERSKRRYRELIANGEKVSLPKVTREMIHRDHNDSSRKYAPLKPSGDAIHIDSTNSTVEEVVEKLFQEISKSYRKAEM